MRYLDLKREVNVLLDSKKNIELEFEELTQRVENVKKQLHIYEDELETESFGIYKNYYNFENSDLYKQKLDEIKKRQKEMVRNRMATNHSLRYEVDGSSDKGKEFILDTIYL